MKTWKVVAMAISLALTIEVVQAQVVTFAPRQRSTPWGSLIGSGLVGGTIAWLRWRKRRRHIGHALHVGDYLVAVRGGLEARYEVHYHDDDEVVWRSGEFPGGDPWYTASHRSSGEPAALDIMLYDQNGVADTERFYIGTWIRKDAAIDTIMSDAGKHPTALNFRFLIDIGPSTVRLVVYPGAEPRPRNDAWGENPKFHTGGTTLWLGRRDAHGHWIRKN